MKTIASNDYYRLSVDKFKNRIYLDILGNWKSSRDVPRYIGDINKAVKNLRRGFTVLSDLTNMRVGAAKVNEVHERAQKILVDSGLKKTAEIMPVSALVKMQVDRYSNASKMNKAQFENKRLAESWLDNNVNISFIPSQRLRRSSAVQRFA